MRKVIASLMLMASIPCQASWDDWSDSDKAWGATALAITVVDMLQTVDISRHPNQFHETNPLLGKHPLTSRVYGYFLASATAGYFVMDSIFKWFDELIDRLGFAYENAAFGGNYLAFMESPERNRGSLLLSRDGGVELREVSFQYPGTT